MRINRGFGPILLADYWAPPHTTDVKVLCNAAALLGVPFQTLCICFQENSNFDNFLELKMTAKKYALAIYGSKLSDLFWY